MTFSDPATKGRNVRFGTPRGGRLLTAVGAMAALALAGCGEDRSANTQSGTTAVKAATEEKPSQSRTQAETSTGPKSPTRQVDEYTGFISPSGNVACAIDTTYARCDVIDRDWSPPPRPADCEFDYGQGISMSPGAPAEFVCAGDTAFGPDEVLPDGSSIVAGVLQCDSAESGFSCRDTESGHGFSISRKDYQLF